MSTTSASGTPIDAAVAKVFCDHFGTVPAAVYSAPGRVNLLGEHTDYNGGASLPFAIQRRTSLSLRIREDNVIRIASTFTDEIVETTVARVLNVAGQRLEGWSAYPLGVLRILGTVADLKSAVGFDALVDSDIPVGVGVSSSHALECA
ncbi:MAG: galactokinase family protein, partial [Galactobacter sp.]